VGSVDGVPAVLRCLDDPACDALPGPGSAQFVDLGIDASWYTNLRTEKC
jgi:hypothetical protein